MRKQRDAAGDQTSPAENVRVLKRYFGRFRIYCYHGMDFTSQELMDMAERLSSCGPEKVAITGVDRDGYIENYCYEKGGRSFIIRTEKVATQRSGTGDVFSAVIAAGAVRGIPFEKSVRTAAEFIRDCLVRSEELDIPVTDGVCFEELMDRLSFDR